MPPTMASQVASIQPTKNETSFLEHCNESIHRTVHFFARPRLVVVRHRTNIFVVITSSGEEGKQYQREVCLSPLADFMPVKTALLACVLTCGTTE